MLPEEEVMQRYHNWEETDAYIQFDTIRKSLRNWQTEYPEALVSKQARERYLAICDSLDQFIIDHLSGQIPKAVYEKASPPGAGI
jgi:hypothetical protein